MNRRMGKRKLTRLILAALMATGGFWGSSAEAAATEYDWGGSAVVGPIVDSGGFYRLDPAFGYNTLNLLSPGNTTKFVEGGWCNDATALTGYTINVKSGIWDGVYGALADSSSSGLVSGNTVTVSGTVNKVVVGGASKGSGNVENNIVNIKGGVVGRNVSDAEIRGGYIEGGSGNATGNKVNIESGGGTATVYGAYTNSTGNVEKNTVTIGGGTRLDGSVYGGRSKKGSATGNEVTIESGAIVGMVRGGSTDNDGTGNADKNTVTINGGTITDEIYGGVSFGGSATGNKIIVNNIDATITRYMPAGEGKTGATDNHIIIKGGKLNNEIYGGMSSAGEAGKNTVTISGGTVTNYIYGGNGNKGASGNIVTISGKADLGEGTARIYGGMTASGAADDNIVNVLVPVNVKHILGGESFNGTMSGNTLNIAATGVVVGDEGVTGFQNMNFYLPSTVKSGDTMLTINAKSELSGAGMATDLQGVTFGVAALSGVSLAKNDTVNLITNPNGLTTDATLKTADSASLGTAEFLTANNLATDTKYTLGISKSGENTIIATVENVTEESGGGSGGGTTITAEDRLKSPVETRAAAVTLLNAGADMLASQGFAQAANAVALEAAEQAKNAEPGAAAPTASTFTPFAAFGGSSMRAESGSHVDTKGFGINVGFAKEFSNSQGKLLFGPVVEYGGGKYDSYNNDIHGDGKSHYWGVGVMARQVNHDSFYYEGSVRFGRVTSDYGANFPAGRVSYDSASNYWAAHLGLGKVFATGKQDTVDAYLKYFYSHQGGDDTTIHIVGGNDEQASFDSVDSNRIRIGARYTHKVNEMNSFYGGLAYQYEFGGEARAHYAGLGEAPSPSVKGSSGMLELGWQVKPNNGPVTIDLGVTGWAGKQRGGSVQLGATWTF